jgi:hypothetical protein
MSGGLIDFTGFVFTLIKALSIMERMACLKLASDPIHFVSASPSRHMSQFFFRKYRRTIGIIDKYSDVAIRTHSVHLGNDRLQIRLLQRLGFLLATASANVLA